MATKAEINAVYAAGLIQGIALVTFPAASTIFTSPSQYGLSNTQYGGALGPAFYGALIGNGSSRTGLFWGYLIGAGIMVIGGLVEIFLGVNAAGKSLEQVTKPLTSVADKADTPATTAVPTAPAQPATA
jgi:hypothetical protein